MRPLFCFERQRIFKVGALVTGQLHCTLYLYFEVFAAPREPSKDSICGSQIGTFVDFLCRYLSLAVLTSIAIFKTYENISTALGKIGGTNSNGKPIVWRPISIHFVWINMAWFCYAARGMTDLFAWNWHRGRHTPIPVGYCTAGAIQSATRLAVCSFYFSLHVKPTKNDETRAAAEIEEMQLTQHETMSEWVNQNGKKKIKTKGEIELMLWIISSAQLRT